MTTELTITPNLDINPWTDILNTVGEMGRITRIGLLPDGTDAGRPTVALLIETGSGTVVAETTWVLLSAAVRALNASPVAEFDRIENPS